MKSTNQILDPDLNLKMQFKFLKLAWKVSLGLSILFACFAFYSRDLILIIICLGLIAMFLIQLVLINKNKMGLAIGLDFIFLYPILSTLPLLFDKVSISFVLLILAFFYTMLKANHRKLKFLNFFIFLLSTSFYLYFYFYHAEENIAYRDLLNGSIITILALISLFMAIAYYRLLVKSIIKLSKGVQFLKQITNANPHFIYTKDKNRKVEFINQTMLDSLGLPAKNFIGKSSESYLGVNSNPKVSEDDTEVLTKGAMFHQIKELLTMKNGKTKWLLTTKLPIYNQAGEIDGLLGVSTDITTKEEREGELMASLSLQQKIIEHFSEAVVLFDTNGKIKVGNNKFISLFDLDSNDNQFDNIDDAKNYLSSKVKEGNLNHLFYPSEKSKESPHVLELKNDKYITCNSETLDLEGEEIGLLIHFKDITKEYLTNQAFLKREEHYKNIFNANNIGLYLSDLSTNINLLDNLKLKYPGKDLLDVFEIEPELFQKMIANIGIADLNEAMIELGGGESREDIFDNFQYFFQPGLLDTLRKEMINYWEGNRSFTATFEFLDLKGNKKVVSYQVEYPEDKSKTLYCCFDVTEKNKALENVNTSRIRFDDLFNGSLDAIVVRDCKNKKFIDLNPSAIALFGYSKSEISADNLQLTPEFQPNDVLSITLIEEKIKKLSKGPVKFEIQRQRKDGSLFYSETTFINSNINDEDEILIFIRDITQKKIADEKIAKSELLYKSFFENNKFAIAKIKNQQIQMCNQAFVDLSGYASNELHNLHYKNFLLDEEIVKVERLRNEMMHGQLKNIGITLSVKKKSGEQIEVYLSSQKMVDDNGNDDGSIVTITDISELKLKESALLESESRYVSIINNTFDAILVVDNNSKLKFCNSSFLKLFNGLSLDALIGTSVNEFFPDIFSNANFTQALEQDNFRARFQNLKAFNLQGEPLQTEASFTTIYFEGEKAILFIIRDISNALLVEMKEAELENKKIQLEKLQREITTASLFNSQKNKLLSEIKDDVNAAMKLDLVEIKSNLKKVKRRIENNLESGEYWLSFKLQFENVHPGFFSEVLKVAPELTTNDLKHCAFIKLNMSPAEVGGILFVEAKSVEMARYRIKTKLNFKTLKELREFLMNI